ncbi:hypothetical protein [Burkholderia multivorans]|uniref:hypothetical protein n=1 Tax=Burkholderia multivorans TaxID=87883 RepID=UPI00158C69E3|nr:hypothetical protein [Burkholderia multivorans]MDR8877550.1 hypothetical protein [Burkholderia multivorans]MDR8882495.1 hypothetical protein [Burkholderia multivorans]MDR8889444.1 hypothetical protein [Burkholderia multivorans]MDR8908797.1 hypothetical protein [Burkholderia multivorans]MDR8913906.1 hypothetical protein [Burkholderia multivorans]
MSFDEFSDQVTESLMMTVGWTEIQVADFISPRTRRLIQAYKDGESVVNTVEILQATPAGIQNWEPA